MVYLMVCFGLLSPVTCKTCCHMNSNCPMWLLIHTNVAHNLSMAKQMAAHVDYNSFLDYFLWLYPDKSRLALNHSLRRTVMLVWFEYHLSVMS